MTLIELLLAISFTAILGLAMASMLSAAGYGTSSSRDLRELVVRGRMLSDRINQTIRYAERVDDIDEDERHVLLRRKTVHNHDDDTATVYYRLLKHDAANDRLLAYDVAYDADEVPAGATAVLNDMDDVEPRVWATGVTAWEIETDDLTPLIRYRLTLEVEGGVLRETVVGAARPRG